MTVSRQSLIDLMTGSRQSLIENGEQQAAAARAEGARTLQGCRMPSWAQALQPPVTGIRTAGLWLLDFFCPKTAKFQNLISQLV